MGKVQVIRPARVVTRPGVGGHPAYDLGQIFGRMDDLRSRVGHGRRTLYDDDLHGAMDLTSQMDEALHLAVQAIEIGLCIQRGKDLVHGQVTVMQGAEKRDIGIPALLTTPLRILRSRLRPATHDRRTQRRHRPHGRT